MKLHDELRNVPLPPDAEERAWRVVRTAWAAREPVPARRRHVRALVLAAAALAVVALAVSSPGRAVLGSLRESVGVKHAAPALFSLPTDGRLLAVSADGPWVVQRDGSKRLLGNWRDASWSPHGLFVVASRRNELTTLEPDGDAHWSLARPEIAFPRWGGSRTDTRIAYLTRSRLHVVAGDGTKDVDVCGEPAAAKVAPAWKPGRPYVLAYTDTRGRVTVLDTDACSLVWRSARLRAPRQLEWSADGRELLVRTANEVLVFPAASGRPIATHRVQGVLDAAWAPHGDRIALLRGGDVLLVHATSSRTPLRVFAAAGGGLNGLAWAPDGRWLLVGWRSADQWIFVRTTGRRRVVAVSNVAAQFEGSFPRLAGWCCAD